MSVKPHVWVVGGGVFANPPACSRWDCLADIMDPLHVDEATATVIAETQTSAPEVAGEDAMHNSTCSDRGCLHYDHEEPPCVGHTPSICCARLSAAIGSAAVADYRGATLATPTDRERKLEEALQLMQQERDFYLTSATHLSSRHGGPMTSCYDEVCRYWSEVFLQVVAARG